MYNMSVQQLLEEASAENARVEQEVIILRNKVYGVTRTVASTSLAVRFFAVEILFCRQQLLRKECGNYHLWRYE